MRQSISFKNEPNITQQHMKAECDVNQIVKRFTDTGIITHVSDRAPQYGVATGQSFTEAMYAVKAVEEEFNRLPAEIRSHFKNDPSLYLDAASDPAEQQFLQDSGLIATPTAPSVENPPQELTEAPTVTPQPVVTNEPEGD